MRGIAALSLPAKYKFKQVYPVAGSWGTVATSTPKKQEINDSGGGRRVLNEKTDPIVAFSRPPPLPPVLGPLMALSLFEMWSSHDSGDD
ncbi:uncharacterized protein LOC110608657 [Manihot esculenta]|uniref:Uncharacterized protein n=1 Tax=Manihot esculenta TaxID=3983 RepID=A0A2C9WA61_MANES|nr:uncharacterized protein LOC110608657 [Manihot esculenta]OAY56459.1 hypothetical protein MANES_02G018400v8 [Manihot esculenta]